MEAESPGGISETTNLLFPFSVFLIPSSFLSPVRPHGHSGWKLTGPFVSCSIYVLFVSLHAVSFLALPQHMAPLQKSAAQKQAFLFSCWSFIHSDVLLELYYIPSLMHALLTLQCLGNFCFEVYSLNTSLFILCFIKTFKYYI